MKHVLLLITTVIAMAFYAVAPAHAQQNRTLKSEMEVLHESLGVNFVYDSAIEINVPYSSKPMKDIIKGNKKEHSVLLEECLMTLFAGTNIEYEVMKKYVVLTQADKRKKPKDYTIFIEEQNDSISEAVITALVDPQRNETQTGLKRIDSKTLNSGFALFSTPDVIKTLQMMPGVSSGTELLSGFYVHGGDGSDNLFLLDGVPIYQSSHLLGLFSAFNSDVISSMDFYKSGFPARYGSKMSSVVDITTKDGDFKEYHGLFSIGLLDGRFQFDGPIRKDKTSFNFGLRRTWTETVTLPLLAYLNKQNAIYDEKMNFRYAFTDLNAKITHKFSNRSVLSANFYTGNDVFKFMSDDASEYWVNGIREYRRDVQDINLGWGNMVGSLNWNYEIDDKISMTNKLYYSGSFSGLGYKEENTRDE
ncbi:MAG: TonB-dependent receptor plug domain-containing protein, partial [Bacteroidales bacterium]|nr:TonB-dependent receptor plug domain-containing protein [Bacteroidales bacterium]